MKIQQLSNFKRSLEGFRKDLLQQLDRLDGVLGYIKRVEEIGERRCPNCFSRDLRFMKNKRLFCRGCGFMSKKKK